MGTPTSSDKHPPGRGSSPPWKTTSFFHPKLEGQRRILCALSPVVMLALGLLFWIMLSLYFGQGYKPGTQLGALGVLVVDMDGGAVGSALQSFTAAFQAQPSIHQSLRWTQAASLTSVINAVNGGDDTIYGAIVLNTGTSTALSNALFAPPDLSAPPYNPVSAFTIIYDEGRNPLPEDLFIQPFCISIVDKFAAAFAAQHASGFAAALLSNASLVNISLAAVSYNSAALGAPLGFTIMNLHPVGTNTVSILATTIANIYLYVLCIVGAIASVRATAVLEPKVKKLHLLLLRFGWLLAFCVVISLVMAVNVAIFRGEFSSNWGVYWLLCLLTACAIAFTQQFLWLLLPPPLFLLATLILLVMNISTGEFLLFLPLSDSFFEYGYAFIFHNSIQAGRTLLFGTFSRLQQNLPILFAWVASSVILSITKLLLIDPTDEAANREAAERFCTSVARIHNVVKRAMARIVEADVKALPPEKLRTLAAFVRAFALFLHGHHSGEDEIIFPAAHARDPTHVGAIIEKLSEQHRSLAGSLAELLELCASAEAFSAVDAERVQGIVREARVWLENHLDSEVSEMNADFYTRFYATEDILSIHARASQHGQTAGDPRLLFPFFVFGMSPVERASFKHSVFPPVRVLLFPGWANAHPQVWRDWAPFVTEKAGRLVWG